MKEPHDGLWGLFRMARIEPIERGRGYLPLMVHLVALTHRFEAGGNSVTRGGYYRV